MLSLHGMHSLDVRLAGVEVPRVQGAGCRVQGVRVQGAGCRFLSKSTDLYREPSMSTYE